jgi:hypothetical protein
MMNLGQPPGGNGNQTYPATAASQPVPAATSKEIPYDYVAVFKLQGLAGNRVEDVINISVDGAFIATAVGYSFIPARFPRQAIPTQAAANGATIFAAAPSTRNALAEWIFANAINSQVLDPRQYFADLASCLARSLCHIDFRYSIIDSGTGRELQNRPIHNIAGLGEPNGERPFRPFARPVLFQPRSTIRIIVEEISTGVLFGYEDPATRQRITSELNIVLHGYKLLGYGTGAP